MKTNWNSGSTAELMGQLFIAHYWLPLPVGEGASFLRLRQRSRQSGHGHCGGSRNSSGGKHALPKDSFSSAQASSLYLVAINRTESGSHGLDAPAGTPNLAAHVRPSHSARSRSFRTVLADRWPVIMLIPDMRPTGQDSTCESTPSRQNERQNVQRCSAKFSFSP